MQLAVFYNRGDFFWIGIDKNKVGLANWFGDVPRAISKYAFLNKHEITKNETCFFVIYL